MLISFSGLDGAGKTTVIAWVQEHLERQGMRVAVFHMTDDIGLYAYARMLRDAAMRLLGRRPTAVAPGAPADGSSVQRAAEDGHATGRRTARSKRAIKRVRDAVIWNRPLRSVIYPVDLLIFLFYRLWFEVVRRRVLVMDRYFYDTLVDLAAGRSRTPDLLQRLTPTPTLAVMLDISPEESFARKGEYSVPYLERRHVAYHRVVPRVSSRLILRNDDLGATQRALADALAECTGSGCSRQRTGHERATLPVESLAAYALQALLGRELSRVPSHSEWAALSALAVRNRVLLRLHARLAEAAVSLPSDFSRAAAAERNRARAMTATIGMMERALSAAGIDYILPKAFMHSPDVGSDIDLLVAAEHGRTVSEVLVDELGGVRRPVHLRHAVAGSASFQIPGCPAHIDVHFGRLGPAGEQVTHAEHLLRHAIDVPDGDARHRTASPADQLVLQGLERVYGRRSLRLSDLVFTIRLVRNGGLDWQYVLSTARRSAAFGGLSCYLACVEQVHRRVFGEELLPADVRRELRLSGWGRLTIRGGQFAFPVVRVATRISLEQLGSALHARRWRSAGRVCLLPLVALASTAARFRVAGPHALGVNTAHRLPEPLEVRHSRLRTGENE